jgi:hypothetical protein
VGAAEIFAATLAAFDAGAVARHANRDSDLTSRAQSSRKSLYARAQSIAA